MNPTLMDALVDLLAFVELSGDEAVDPDAGVRAMESAAATLQRLSRGDRQAFISHLRQKVETERKKSMPTEWIDFLVSLAENLGLEK